MSVRLTGETPFMEPSECWVIAAAIINQLIRVFKISSSSHEKRPGRLTTKSQALRSFGV